MSSYNSISLASSRQFETKHTQSRIELSTQQAASIADAEPLQVNTLEFEQVSVTLSAEQTVQVNLLNRLFGRKVSFPTLELPVPPSQDTLEVLQPVDLSQNEDLEFILTQNHYYEFEQTQFSAQGQLTLSDGTETNFNFHMSYSREFETYSQNLMAQSELKDPLVINFSARPLSLLGETFEFDLNTDGQIEDLPLLSEGAAFIALDKNHNGKIDDGTELFGAQSGNGFTELANYDQDNNGVINKNDAIFDQLLVWSPGENGTLMKLSDTDVDSLLLQTVDTPYRFTDSNNQTLGQMRQSSIYANQNGSVGGLHQIDLAI